MPVATTPTPAPSPREPEGGLRLRKWTYGPCVEQVTVTFNRELKADDAPVVGAGVNALVDRLATARPAGEPSAGLRELPWSTMWQLPKVGVEVETFGSLHFDGTGETPKIRRSTLTDVGWFSPEIGSHEPHFWRPLAAQPAEPSSGGAEGKLREVAQELLTAVQIGDEGYMPVAVRALEAALACTPERGEGWRDIAGQLGPEEVSYQVEQGEDGVVAEAFSTPEDAARQDAQAGGRCAGCGQKACGPNGEACARQDAPARDARKEGEAHG